MGRLYSMANVTGPSEFGELPYSDQLFWWNWMVERIRRENDENEKVQEMMG